MNMSDNFFPSKTFQPKAFPQRTILVQTWWFGKETLSFGICLFCSWNLIRRGAWRMGNMRVNKEIIWWIIRQLLHNCPLFPHRLKLWKHVIPEATCEQLQNNVWFPCFHVQQKIGFQGQSLGRRLSRSQLLSSLVPYSPHYRSGPVKAGTKANS